MSFVSCMCAFMSSTERGPFGVGGVLLFFLKDSDLFDCGVDDFFKDFF